ncbi:MULTISPECIES: pilus assembly protein FlpE [unclassified Knoellia]|uniref:pilus assembly protein FlpE n=1 Tax=Knoellia altitudinis TaxID=3404795 RepID=UPI00362342DC
MTSSSSPLATPLVVVLGASGGLGASTWAAALARRLSLHLGECVLVDGDVRGGGLDMTCGTEHVPGLRWPDLARLRGTTSCARLIAALPCGEVPVLSAGGRGGAVPDSVVLDVVASMRGVVPVVVDLPGLTSVAESLIEGAEAVHVVSGLQARRLADTEALIRDVGELAGARLGLVTRSSGGIAPELDEVLEHLGAAHLAHLRTDARVLRDGERGEWPGLRGALRDSADRVVLDLVDHLSVGAA